MTARVLTRFAVVLAAVALALVGFAGSAVAQDVEPQLPYPGPLRGVPADQPIESPGLGGTFLDVDAKADPATTVGGTGGGNATVVVPGLAVTGSETEPIAAVAVGLLAVGGSVLVTSRRRMADAAR